MSTNLKLGLQMWSIHDVFVKQGFEYAFKKMAEMGYQGIEFAMGGSATLSDRVGYDVDPKEVRKMMDYYGIEAFGNHIAMGELLRDPKKVIEENQILGISYAATGPAFEADRLPKRDQIQRYEDCVKAAKLCKENGIQFQVHCAVYGYMRDYKGRMTWEGMIEEAGVDLLQPEFDTAWVLCSGYEIPTLMSKYKGHVDILHLKDYKPVPYDTEYILVRHNEVCDHGLGCAVGDAGVLNVEQAVKSAEANGSKWVVTELWNEPNCLENAKISADNIKKYL